MRERVAEEPVEDVPRGSLEESLEIALPEGEITGSGGPPGRPQVTFRGNNYDLVSLGALVTGVLILFSCVTCNTSYYCLPLISVALGAVGVLGAQQSVEAERTRLWSWLGIAAGGIVLLLVVLFFVLYIGFIVLMILSEAWG